jgi:MFS transporter, PPP family, 3-phenylpropionic acid transporter
VHKGTILRILYFLFFCCTASRLPLLADYCKSRGLTGTQISLILSITPVMMFIVQPLVGIIADKIGYKKTLLISSLLASASYLGYLYKNDFGWLIFVTAFHGFIL